MTPLPHSELKRIINSTCNILEQPPPPSLRDVLSAYNARGDGDRDMLIAMLNAKTAEDQRLASIASLHRTLLEFQGISPSSFHIPPPQLHPGNHDYDPAPPMYPQDPIRSPPHSDLSQRSSSFHTCRKRLRTSYHPASPITTSSRRSSSPRHRHPSPHSRSSSRSDSTEYSPRSRTSMAIGSLLSTTSPGNGDSGTAHYGPHRHPTENHGHVNGYLSPPTSLGPISV